MCTFIKYLRVNNTHIAKHNENLINAYLINVDKIKTYLSNQLYCI